MQRDPRGRPRQSEIPYSGVLGTVGAIASPVLPKQRLVAAASPGCLDKHGYPAEPADLLGRRLIGHRFESGKLGVWELEREGEIVRVPPQGPLLSSSQDLEVDAALAGVGIIRKF